MNDDVAQPFYFPFFIYYPPNFLLKKEFSSIL